MRFFKIANLISLILTREERLHATYLFFWMLFVAFIEVAGVASIMPFLAIAASVDIIFQNKVLNEIYNLFGFESTNNFLFFLGLVSLLSFVVSTASRAFLAYFQLRFSLSRERNISVRLLKTYLSKNFEWFLRKNASSLLKTVLSEVSIAIESGLIPLLQFVAQTCVALSLLILLLIVDPYLALAAFSFVGTFYYIIYAKVTRRVSHAGEIRSKMNERRFFIASEAVTAIKDIKMYQKESEYIKLFDQCSLEYVSKNTQAQIISQLPRFAIELIAFGGLVTTLLFLIEFRGDFASVVPIVAVFAFAGYRLIPALQNVYFSIIQMKFSEPVLLALADDVQQNFVDQEIQTKRESDDFVAGDIVLENVSYRYGNNQKLALDGVNLTFPLGSHSAVVGPSGGGKTTLVEIVAGLLHPTNGTLSVGGVAVTNDNVTSWRPSVSYVSQDFYLSPVSIAENIAFGVPKQDIDTNLLREVARIADISTYIEQDLPFGYDTLLGDRGSKLSGGQRQRIAIARALYKQPKYLILDEGTSALDGATEASVVSSLNKSLGDISIISVAHRHSSIVECDVIYLVDGGSVKGSGSYSDLYRTNKLFRNLAKTSRP